MFREAAVDDFILPREIQSVVLSYIPLELQFPVVGFFTGKVQDCRPRDICRLCAKYGELDLLKWARASGYGWDSSTCAVAARYNNLELLKYAISEGCPSDSTMAMHAARNENFEALKWISSETKAPRDTSVCASFAENGNLGMFKWAVSNGYECSHNILRDAAAFGKLEILKYAGNIHQIDSLMSVDAARFGQIHVLDFLLESKIAIHETVPYVAAFYNQLDVLKWAKTRGYFNQSVRIPAYVMRRLQQLYGPAGRDVYCEIDKWTARYERLDDIISGFAALYGNLDMLKWAISKGILSLVVAIRCAFVGEHVETIKFLTEYAHKIDDGGSKDPPDEYHVYMIYTHAGEAPVRGGPEFKYFDSDLP